MQSGDDMPLLRTMTDIEQVADTMLLLMGQCCHLKSGYDVKVLVDASDVDHFYEVHIVKSKEKSESGQIIKLASAVADNNAMPYELKKRLFKAENENEFPCLFRVPAKVAGILVTSHSILLCTDPFLLMSLKRGVERPKEVIWCYKRGWIMGLMAIRFLQCLGLPILPRNMGRKPTIITTIKITESYLHDGGDKSSGEETKTKRS
nr:hypothetical protein [Tanacetum cinerariifolium]